MIVTLFFAALLAVTLWASWGKPMGQVARFLLYAGIVTNVCAYTLDGDWQPVVYPLLAVLIGWQAADAGIVHRNWRPMAIVGLNLLVGIVTVAYAVRVSPAYADKWLLVFSTNVIFAAECFLIIWWGMRDAVGGHYNFNLFDSRSRRTSELACGKKEP